MVLSATQTNCRWKCHPSHILLRGIRSQPNLNIGRPQWLLLRDLAVDRSSVLEHKLAAEMAFHRLPRASVADELFDLFLLRVRLVANWFGLDV